MSQNGSVREGTISSAKRFDGDMPIAADGCGIANNPEDFAPNTVKEMREWMHDRQMDIQTALRKETWRRRQDFAVGVPDGWFLNGNGVAPKARSLPWFPTWCSDTVQCDTVVVCIAEQSVLGMTFEESGWVRLRTPGHPRAKRRRRVASSPECLDSDSPTALDVMSTQIDVATAPTMATGIAPTQNGHIGRNFA